MRAQLSSSQQQRLLQEDQSMRGTVHATPCQLLRTPLGNGLGLPLSSSSQKLTMRQAEYKAILTGKLLTKMTLQACDAFLNDKALCHTACSVILWLASSTDRLPLDRVLSAWPEPYGEHVAGLKDNAAAKQPSSMSEFIEPVKHCWVFEISCEYCENHTTTYRISPFETNYTAANTEASTFLLLFIYGSVFTLHSL